jgi:hypothetical protein
MSCILLEKIVFECIVIFSKWWESRIICGLAFPVGVA